MDCHVLLGQNSNGRVSEPDKAINGFHGVRLTLDTSIHPHHSIHSIIVRSFSENLILFIHINQNS